MDFDFERSVWFGGDRSVRNQCLFEHWREKYGNEEKYPYGPPSHITRQIIDNPDTPIRNLIRQHAYAEKRTGFLLIVFGGLMQLMAIWI